MAADLTGNSSYVVDVLLCQFENSGWLIICQNFTLFEPGLGFVFNFRKLMKKLDGNFCQMFTSFLFPSMPSEHNVADGQPLPPPTAMFGYPPNYHGPPGNYPPPDGGPQYYGKPFYILPPPSGLPMYHPMQQMYAHPPPPPLPANGPMPSEEPQPVESSKPTKRKRQTQPPHYEVLELKTNAKGQTKRQKNANKANDEDHCECDQVGGRMECDACGASYAHPKCLAKHRWDRHMDRWSMVEGMLEMNKQQQVQVMEVRKVCFLLGMIVSP
jgi:hypothetical protein